MPEYRSGKSHRAVFRENSEQDARLLIRNVQAAALAVSQGKLTVLYRARQGEQRALSAQSVRRARCQQNGRKHLPFDRLTTEEEIELGAAHRLVRVCPVIKTLTQWE
jgi:hypothetical protein